MAEARTSYQGTLLRLSDERVQDFVADVSLIMGLHNTEPTQIVSTGLEDLAIDLSKAARDLEDRLNNTESTNYNKTPWNDLVALSTMSVEYGPRFLEAYQQLRLNKLLNVEFGPAESSTTSLLRAIGSEAVSASLRKMPLEDIPTFFNTFYSSRVLGSFFKNEGSSSNNKRRANQVLEEYMVDKSRSPEIVHDAAYARVLSTLIYCSYDIVYCIPEQVRIEALLHSKEQFKDNGMRTKGSKQQIISWPQANDEETKPDNTSFDHEASTLDEEMDELNIVDSVGAVGTFDMTRGNCHVDRDDDLDNNLHKALVGSMISMMFPSDGVGFTEAQKICNDGCPVKAECLDFALVNRIEHGVWGGVSERGRRKILQLGSKKAS